MIKNKRIQPRTIDLFCGAGGSSYGARKAGAKIVAGFDNWAPAVATYKENFPEAKNIYNEDLRELSPESVKAEIGEIDLILASPECTNHSMAKGAKEVSEESRETAFEVIRFAKVFKPEWIIVENVVQMQNWDGHKILKDALGNDLQYKQKEYVLNAKDFGVPQSRERLFLVCSKQSQPSKPENSIFCNKIAEDIIDKTEKYKFTKLRKPGRAEKTIRSAENAIKTLGEEEPFLLVYYGSGRNGNGNGNGGWQKLDEPLRTITTLDRFAYVIPGSDDHEMRMLQPEELKLAMGYKYDFKLDSVKGLTRRQRVKLMGNGVCPPVMEQIIRSLIRDG